MIGARFVAGVVAARQTTAPWRPRGAMTLLAGDGWQVWATGYSPSEILSAGDGPTAALAVGLCLATAEEWQHAARSAATGAWGPATRQRGPYLTVLRDADDTMRVAGDRAGTVPVYWRTVGGLVLWATAATPLAAYTGASPNPAALLTPLAVRGVDPAGASHFTGVRRVPPGHALVLAPRRPPRTEPVPGRRAPLSLEDGAALLNETLTEAVARRAQRAHPLSADLSGGVDSSTLACLAATTGGPLLAVTYTDTAMAEQDDLRYARQIAAAVPAITHQVVHGAATVRHFDGLDGPGPLPHTDLPAYTLGLLAIKDAQLAPVAAAGSAAHLTGRGGDDVLDAVAAMVVDQYRAGHRLEAAQHATALARTWRTSAHRVLRQAAATHRTTYPQALAALAARLSGREVFGARPAPQEQLAWCGLMPGAGWLTPTGRDAVAELVAARAQDADPDAGPGEVAERLALELMGAGHAEYKQIARQRWGLDVHAPYLDTPVVDVCHAVPGWQRRRPGDFKPIARAAFTGTVPAFLLERHTKTAFTSSLYSGIRANAATLGRIIDSSRLADAALIDAARVRASLAAAVRGEAAPLAGLHALIVTELWLTTLPPRDTWWESTDQPQQQEALT
ncbi:asparagine synthase-related protein [Kitasatospora purpeofusca]|uniref:asparagine synthase-related protein n=1 Tax=Kitasatospora purpeofusca TaxID=67352 RepID=UPI0038664178